MLSMFSAFLLAVEVETFAHQQAPGATSDGGSEPEQLLPGTKRCPDGSILRTIDRCVEMPSPFPVHARTGEQNPDKAMVVPRVRQAERSRSDDGVATTVKADRFADAAEPFECTRDSGPCSFDEPKTVGSTTNRQLPSVRRLRRPVRVCSIRRHRSRADSAWGRVARRETEVEA